MADNTTLNTMTGGDVIAALDVGGVKWQRVLDHKDAVNIEVTSAGLTTVTTAYIAGDQVGTILTLTNAARASGKGGLVTDVQLISAADIIGAFDVIFFDRSVTLAADNAAFAISDADALFVEALIQLAGAYDLGNNRLGQNFTPFRYVCNATSLFAALVTRVGHTFFGATTDLQLAISCERD